MSERKKSEVGSPKPEEKQKAESRKRKAAAKPEALTPMPEAEKNTASDSYRDSTPNSELNESGLNKSEVEIPKSEIKTMEVHHHPQLEKKGFKEYLPEGLMIFLAVMMGFFAETIRENISENGKAKELAISLYKEVYADSVNLQFKLKLRTQKEIEINYFRNYVADSSLTHLSDKFYPSFVWSFVLTSSIIFDPNDGVLNQLRNSGAQRYFKSVPLQNCISSIDVTILNVRNRNAQEYAFVEQFARPFLMKHYDFKFEDNFTHNGKLSTLEAIEQTNFQPINPPKIRNISSFSRDDAEALGAYYLLMIRATRQIFYAPYMAANHRLLQELRKEYNISNE